jgi:adenosylhomocysteine nucleosidase
VVYRERVCASVAGDGVSGRVAIVAALPREIAELVRGTKPDAALLKRGIHLHELPGAVVVAAGMGMERVTLAVEAAMNAAEITSLVSVGLAGGCSAIATAGCVLEARTTIDARSGESYASGYGDCTLVTAVNIAGVAEKARLRDTYGAAMVDMEAATVARLAVAKGIPFRAIKGISDAHDFELAALGRFTSKQGHFNTLGFALHTAMRPHAWGKTMKLGRHSSQALVALTAMLKHEFQLN